MDHKQHPHESGSPAPTRWRWSSRIVFAVLLGIAAFFLFTEHRAHLYGALPYVLLALCPLMHLFHGHGGHGHHGEQRDSESTGNRNDKKDW